MTLPTQHNQIRYRDRSNTLMANNYIEESVLSVDIGGSHITAAVVHVATQTVVPSSIIRRKIDAHASAEIIIEAWGAALVDAEEAWGSKCDYLAVSMPGPFDYERGISFIKGMNKYEALFGMDIKQAFADRIGLPAGHIWFMNDAEAFLRGEVCRDTHKHHERFFGLTLGTGLGSAFFEQGEVTDLNLGSSPFLDGITEDYISSRGILTYYRSLGGTNAADVKTLVHKMEDDTHASAAIRQLAIWLADFLLKHVPTLTPDMVVIGGNISKAHALFLPEVAQILDTHGMRVPMKVVAKGEQAAMLGAASFINSLKKNSK